VKSRLVKTVVIWGLILWLIGYLLSVALFAFVPVSTIGWIVLPIGLAVTIWALAKRILGRSMTDYFLIGIVWTVIAVILDFLLIVKLFSPSDGYYKLDVYIYYASTFLLPLIVGVLKTKQTTNNT
jgi:hypothetical protein